MIFIVRAKNDDSRWIDTFNISTSGRFSLRTSEILTDSETELDYRYMNPFKFDNLSRSIEGFNKQYGPNSIHLERLG